MKHLILFLFVLVLSTQCSNAQAPYSSGKSIAYSRPITFFLVFDNLSSLENRSGGSGTFDEGLIRNEAFDRLYDMEDLKEYYPFLNGTFNNVSYHNNDGLDASGSTAGIGVLSLNWHKNKWLAFGISIGHVIYGGESNSSFYGERNDSVVSVFLNYKQRVYSMINDYKVRFTSPFWFGEKFALFYEAGFSLKWNWASDLNEVVRIQTSFPVSTPEDPTPKRLIEDEYWAPNKKIPFGLDLTLLNLGYCLRVTNEVALEGVFSYRVRSKLLSVDYNPYGHLFAGMAIRVDLSTMEIGQDRRSNSRTRKFRIPDFYQHNPNGPHNDIF